MRVAGRILANVTELEDECTVEIAGAEDEDDVGVTGGGGDVDEVDGGGEGDDSSEVDDGSEFDVVLSKSLRIPKILSERVIKADLQNTHVE